MEGSPYELALLALREGKWKDVLCILQDGASKGNGLCMWWLGRCHEKGIWTPKDEQKAIEWYRKGADVGNARSCIALAVHLEPTDKPKALSLAKEVLTISDDQFSVGACHFHGLGTLKNYVKAFNCFKQANDPFSVSWVSYCYYKGYGTLQNREEARNWDFLAASEGMLENQYNLGDDFQYMKDYESAIYWFRKAAEQEDADSQYYLILLFLKMNKKAAALYWSTRLFQNYDKKYETKLLEITEENVELFNVVRKCRQSCMTLIAIRKYRQSVLSVIPKDVVVLLAKALWDTRDEDAWMWKEFNNKKHKI